MEYGTKEIQSDQSIGYLFQLGTGFIQGRLYVDLIVRSLFSPRTFQYKTKVENSQSHVREDINLFIFQPILRIGFSF